MTEKHVEVSRDDSVQVIRFVNEKSRNSLTAEMRSQLGEALVDAAEDESVRVVYITGKGAAFCAGGDLHMLKNEWDPWSVHRRFQRLGRWFPSFLQFAKPVVVGVNGYAVGGGMGLALGGDIVIAAQSAKFVAGFFRLGVVPDVGTMYTLPRIVGMARAKRMLFCNETVTGQEAFDMGLVARVVPDDQLDGECLKQAHKLATGPAKVMGVAKMIMARSFETGLNEMFMLEGFGQGLAMSSDEFHEGLSAMLEQRPADFVHPAPKDKPKKSSSPKKEKP